MTADQGPIQCHKTEPEMILLLDDIMIPLDTAIFGVLRMRSGYFPPKLHQMPFWLSFSQETDVTCRMASTSATSTAKTTEGDMPLKYDIPPPISFEKSKLDWLLVINEQYFEAELRTVVSILNHSQSIF